jgi:hypothetical protein
MAEEAQEAELRRYLLGSWEETPALDCQAIELRILSDPDFSEFLLALEDEIIDDYLAGRLSPKEAQQFHRRFAQGAADRVLRIEIARALRRNAPRTTRAPTTPFFWKVSAAAAALAAVLVSFNFWLPNDIVRFTLASAALRGDGALPRLDLGPDIAAVELELELDSTGYPAYAVSLNDADGRPLVAEESLAARPRGERSFVRLRVARDHLPPGDYVVSVSGVTGDGMHEPLGSYVFRVLPR